MGARNLARKEMFRKLWCFLAACCFLSHPSIVWCSVVVDVVATKAVKKKAKENICILCSSSIFSALLYILTTISVKLCHPLPPPRKRRQTSSLGFQWRPECYRCARKHTGVLCPISAFIFFLRIPHTACSLSQFRWHSGTPRHTEAENSFSSMARSEHHPGRRLFLRGNHTMGFLLAFVNR